MMLVMKRICVLFVLFMVCTIGIFSSRAWAQPIKIVATQETFSSIVRKIGGDRVDVWTIAPPKYNIHFIEPKPSDVRAVASARLYINSGLDLEAWSDPLLEAAGNPILFKGREGNVDLSDGIRLLNVPHGELSRSHGDIHANGNPHYHMDPANAKNMALAIVDKLNKTDPEHAEFYTANGNRFIAELEERIKSWKSMCHHCVNQELISYHDDIAYLADFLGIKVDQFIEPKPGIPPTPKHLLNLEKYMRQNQVKAIVMPTYYSRSQAQRLSEKTGAKILMVAQAVGEIPSTEDIFSFYEYNIKQISGGLRRE